jgi:hypothetical protein
MLLNEIQKQQEVIEDLRNGSAALLARLERLESMIVADAGEVR